MSNIKIITSPNHPLIETLSDFIKTLITVDPISVYELDANDFEDAETIIDLTCFDTDTKKSLIEKLELISDAQIISDLTVNWGESLIDQYTNLKGAIAACFWSPKATIECWSEDYETFKIAEDFFKSISIKLEKVNSPGISFTYPRVISMIINEAYFSQGEELASDDDIDTAMKFGVNYPVGPFEWARIIGRDKIVMVLDELYRVTGDPRYRASQKLRFHA